MAGRLHIDPTETNWYLKNRKTWGNPKRIGLILLCHFIFWFIVIESLAIPSHKTGDYTLPRLFQVVSALIPTLFDVYLYVRFPTFDDHLSISDEVKHTLRLEILMVLSYTIVGVLLRATFISIKYFLVSMIMPIILFMFTFFSLYYPLAKCNLPTMPWNALKFKRKGTQSLEIPKDVLSELPRMNTNDCTVNIMHANQFIYEVLSIKHGFEGFARHLVKEWCLENLLFLIETQQWIDALRLKDEYQACKQNRLSLQFCDNAPKSRITMTVYNCEDGMENEYMQSIQLFVKYIANGGQFCLNLDYRSRAKLYLEFGLMDTNANVHEDTMFRFMKESAIGRDALITIFDSARDDIFGLLIQSLHRFQMTEEFKIIQDELTLK